MPALVMVVPSRRIACTITCSWRTSVSLVIVAVQVVPNETSSVTSWLVTARPGSSGAVTGAPATVTFASTGVPEILIWSFT